MSQFKRLCPLLITLLVCASRAAGSPFTNGGFETFNYGNPATSSSSSTPAPGDYYLNGFFSGKQLDSIDGWTFSGTQNSFFLEEAGRHANDGGVVSVCLNGDGGTAFIQQTFDTVIGQHYDVQFAFTDEGRDVSAGTHVTVSANTTVTTSQTYGASIAGFTTEDLPFTATGTSTTVEFLDTTNYGSVNPNESPLLDSVALPEPHMALPGMILLAILLATRRRTSSRVA